MHVVLTGASSAGKSSLLAEMAARGYPVVQEPGRRVIRAGGPLPWEDAVGFARACFALALQDLDQAEGAALFDRSAIDAAVNLQQRGQAVPGPEPRYAPAVFMAPPWADIYVTDPERQHGFVEASAEYDWLLEGYRDRGYRIRLLPFLSVAERADWMAQALAELGWPG